MPKEFVPDLPYNTPAILLIPQYKKIKGVNKKIYPNPESGGEDIFISFRTFGGTEQENNGVYSIRDTASIETWYRPDITSDCRIILKDTQRQYDIIAEPEDVGMKHLYLKFKAERVAGGA